MTKRSRAPERRRAPASGDAPAARHAVTARDDQRQFFETALAHVPDPIAICDARGRIVFVNPAARRLAVTDAIGTELRAGAAVWGDWFDPDDQPLAPEAWPILRALHGETTTDREVYRRYADGKRSWLLLSAAPVRDADGSIIGAVTTSKDITDRRQAEERVRTLNAELEQRVRARTAAFEAAQRELEREVRERLEASELLERNRRMLQAILNRSTTVIYVKDTAFRYLLINTQFEQLFNVTNADVAGKTDYDLFSSEIVAPLRTNDERVLATGEPLHIDEVVPQDDGLHTYVSVKFPLRDDDGAIYALCGISTDITERKAMEAALRRSQTTLSAVIESSTDAIVLLDRNHHMVICNAVVGRFFESLFGVPMRAGADLRDELPIVLAARWHTYLDRALGGDRFAFEETMPIEGSVRHFLMSLNPIMADGRVTGVTLFAKDITELKRTEEELRQHQAELAHVLRLHTMGEMAASLAHEINQPLGAIANYAQGGRRRLEAGSIARAELLHTMEEITNQALRAGEITRRVREVLYKSNAPREPVSINTVVGAALDIVGPMARERTTILRFRQGVFLPQVEVDSIQIEQVVMNLVLNALDAIDLGSGTREIEVHTSSSADDTVEVSVRDSGVGIDAALVEKVFEPFHTTKLKGLGMGLAISRSIIEAHNGRLWAVPNPEGGSTFCFTLPATPTAGG